MNKKPQEALHSPEEGHELDHGQSREALFEFLRERVGFQGMQAEPEEEETED
jgi:hypothetical protein